MYFVWLFFCIFLWFCVGYSEDLTTADSENWRCVDFENCMYADSENLGYADSENWGYADSKNLMSADSEGGGLNQVEKQKVIVNQMIDNLVMIKSIFSIQAFSTYSI